MKNGLALVLSLAVAGSAAAQQPDMVAMPCGGGMAMPGMSQARGRAAMRGMPMDSAMHRMMGSSDMTAMMGPPSPAMILEHRDQLKLTSAQVTRLTALQRQAEPECTKHMNLAMAAHMTANRMLGAAAPDFDVYATRVREASAHMADGHVVMAKAAVSARQLLTASQRQTLEDLMDQMHEKKK